MEVVRALLRSDLRRRWRAWAALALLVALVGGVAMASVAGYRRTSSAMDRFLAYHRPPNAFVEGRLDDVIVRGGENMSPGEIEDVLRAHPAVADVAVLGVPDDHWGEKVAAVVVARDPAPSPEDLAAWVRARLRSTKTPEVWAFREALPYNDTGKLLRRQLKAEMTAKSAAA